MMTWSQIWWPHIARGGK